ncbi:MAG: tRNA (adenosine(37)-N6)-dimethylallyltransferase MiaA [Candidatus Cloacimonetes bacterium HGW-Cloacimonetes-1]|jgi:tRNA dimethylallyltransferase|nr:MAG: tRNA (adenosine(37)-N6)-dimethylallyltransferase MiaA [Candidatus Cloacimonetes bacterium HGW-Cloacimonetes-1]
MIPLIVIEGPTAVGKSALALDLALELQTELISADSRQVYRYLDIGTAKPSADEQSKIRHHLIDIIEPGQSYNAGSFAKDALDCARSIYDQGKIPIVCGGTGLYIRAMLTGLFPAIEINPQIRRDIDARMETEPLSEIYSELVQCDPVFAAQISCNDKQRIQRGLEVYISTGKPISQHWQEQESTSPYKPFKILVTDERANLYAKINNRVQQMLDKGLLQEIEFLLQQGYTSDDPGMKTMGYKEFIPYLLGDSSLEECQSDVCQHTRNYAKRQFTWYKKCDFDLTLNANEVSLSLVLDKINRSW